MQRRARVALEERERRRREIEERDQENERLRVQRERVEEERQRQEAKRREEEEEKRVNDQKELEKLRQEMLQCERVKVDEKPITRSRSTLNDLETEQQGAAETMASSTVKSQKQRVRKPLINSWVGKQETSSDSTQQPPAARKSLVSQSM